MVVYTVPVRVSGRGSVRGQPMVVYTVPVRVSGRGSVLEDGEDEADLLTTPLHVSSQSFYFDHWSMCHKLDVTNKTCEDLDVDYHVTGPFKVVSGPNERTPTELTEGRLLAPSQRYVQMSIYFCPEAVGQFTGELRLWLGHAPWSHLVQLGGNCRPGEPEALRDTQLAGGL
ncbi:hypothetical protein FJT64_022616 [Amphibalanus amphitrite]|uniref:Uncharacterized protein n=1 Tax=Amphibalanus amphitrite TaxID=1232801 RepID=A0A6A4WPY5_AMPAM|nr:hypothetical protein FJT64_022616 [Amphibalanus amphitrite]